MLVFDKLRQYWWASVDDEGYDIPLTQVDQMNAIGERPIHIAAWKGDVEDVVWLLQNGADVNQRGDFLMTPLHYAYMGKKNENVKVLLKFGADELARCDRGLFPYECQKKPD
ncbi:Ankyrin repeats (3 copies) [compost metagenome]